MSLDLFASNIDDAVAYAGRVSAPELPSTFSDNFNDAWNKGYLTSQSISGATRTTQARRELIDSAIAKIGDQSLGTADEDGSFDIARFNARVAEHKAKRPELDVQPISDEAIQARADEIGVRQLADSASLARRERTTGGAVGSFLGSAGAALTDPVNMVAFPLAAPESLGILGTALAWGAIGAGSQTAIEALNASSMERIQPGYSTSGEPVTNILEAGGFAGALGGSLKSLSTLWQRQKSGAWPRTVRDAGNVIDSEVQIATTNPFAPVPATPAQRLIEAAVPLHPDNSIVFVDAAKVDAMLGPMNRTFVAEKRARAKDFIASTPESWNPPEMNARVNSRNGKDMIDIVDGVHRWAAMRDDAMGVVPVEMNAASIKKARQMGLLADRPTFSSVDQVAGEATHRTALNKAIDDLANNRPVDVDGIVPPEMASHIEAYHGSPHDFEAFDSTRIGTGEGAQAYGHGLYFAESPTIAKSYQSKVSAMQGLDKPTIEGRPINWDDPHETAAFELTRHNGDRAAAADFYERNFKGSEVSQILRSDAALPEVKMPGHIYKVNINAAPEHFLDWDKPLSEQSEYVRNALAELDINPSSDAFGRDILGVRSRGGTLAHFDELAGMDPHEISAELQKVGIRGIKYMDAGSRGIGPGQDLASLEQHLVEQKDRLQQLRDTAGDLSGQAAALREGFIQSQEKTVANIEKDIEFAKNPTRNIVVFDEKHVQITHKNGKPVNAEIRQSVVDQAAGRPPSVGPDLVLDQMSKKYGPETSMDAWAPEDRQRYFRAIDQDAAAKAVSSIDDRWTPDAAGAEADVFFHGDFAVRRMRDEADALPERPQSAHVLQSISRDAERRAEVLPFVKDVDYLKAFDPAEARGLVDGLQRDGLMIIDDGAANFGHHDGRLVVVDPGSVVPIPTKAELSQGKYPPAEWKEFVHTAKQYGVDLKPAQTPYPPVQPELALSPPAAPEPAKPAGPNAEAVKSLDDDLTPAKIEEARAHPDMEETVARDLDKLMLERPDMEVPTGVTVDAEGRTVSTSRKVEDVVAEADARSAAAKEIEACVGPYPAQAAE